MPTNFRDTKCRKILRCQLSLRRNKGLMYRLILVINLYKKNLRIKL